MAVEFRVSDLVEAWIGDRVVELGHIRQRCVPAVLLIETNEWLSADQLLDRVRADGCRTASCDGIDAWSPRSDPTSTAPAACQSTMP
ncbi:hypothetical protein [Actinosynnema sp. NPDC023587]|uniref:hypothetical protein n=1 Tax=Actinosynnema sp. NPDC023587 TaxID=3154695 RepID=UPI0033D1E318